MGTGCETASRRHLLWPHCGACSHVPLDLREDAADGLADDQVGAPVVGGGRRVHEDEAPALVVVDEPGRRVDRQQRAAHDQHVRPRYGQDGPLQRRRVQSLAVEHDVRAHHGGARRAVGHAPGPGLVEVVDGGARAAPRALQPRPVPVELEHALGARGLVEAVDVLGDHRLQFRVIGQNVLVEGLVPGVVVGGGVVEFVEADCVAPAGDDAGGLVCLAGVVPGIFEGCVGGHGRQDRRCWLRVRTVGVAPPEHGFHASGQAHAAVVAQYLA